MKIEHIEQWIGRDVLDADGEKVGKLSEVHFDGDRPVVGEITTGRISKKQHLVPLREASATRDDLRVPYPKATIEGVGGPSPDGRVTHEELAGVATAYGVHLGVDPDTPQTLEGSRAREERKAAQAAALARAEELDREAALRAEEAAAAEKRAQEAADAATDARAAQQRAEQAAADYRAEAGTPA
jgi:sporulation protein YlmC with PRC-barrel domain